jgi:glycosyltransferase involved in cell wall biosynthesis
MVDQQITALNEGPLVSVIIPAYNAENFITETLKSVLGQTYKNIEVIVVDDGSQDKTAEIVEKFIAIDQRVKLLKQVNSGVAVARNTGIAHAQGEFIAPIDADDIWYPENIAKQVECFGRSPENVGLVYSWSAHIDETGLITGGFCVGNITGNVYTTLIWQNFIGNASCTMMRSSVLEKVGLYNYQLRQQKAQGCEDWDLYLRIAEFYEFAVVPEFLVGYRKTPNTMSKDYEQMARSHSLMLQANRQKHPEVANTIYRIASSTFYLYLAQENHQNSNYQGTRYWLYKSWQAEPITPCLRLVFYQLIISCIGDWLINKLPITSSDNVGSDNFNNQNGQSVKKSQTLFDLKKPNNSMQRKLLISQILHQIVPKIEQKQDQ